MPKGKSRGRGSKSKESAFGLYMILMFIALGLFVWLVLKTLGYVDPTDAMSMNILITFLGVMITAQIVETWDFRKKIIDQGERISRIEGMLEGQTQNQIPS